MFSKDMTCHLQKVKNVYAVCVCVWKGHTFYEFRSNVYLIVTEPSIVKKRKKVRTHFTRVTAKKKPTSIDDWLKRKTSLAKKSTADSPKQTVAPEKMTNMSVPVVKPVHCRILLRRCVDPLNGQHAAPIAGQTVNIDDFDEGMTLQEIIEAKETSSTTVEKKVKTSKKSFQLQTSKVSKAKSMMRSKISVKQNALSASKAGAQELENCFVSLEPIKGVRNSSKKSHFVVTKSTSSSDSMCHLRTSSTVSSQKVILFVIHFLNGRTVKTFVTDFFIETITSAPEISTKPSG